MSDWRDIQWDASAAENYTEPRASRIAPQLYRRPPVCSLPEKKLVAIVGAILFCGAIGAPQGLIIVGVTTKLESPSLTVQISSRNETYWHATSVTKNFVMTGPSAFSDAHHSGYGKHLESVANLASRDHTIANRGERRSQFCCSDTKKIWRLLERETSRFPSLSCCAST